MRSPKAAEIFWPQSVLTSQGPREWTREDMCSTLNNFNPGLASLVSENDLRVLFLGGFTTMEALENAEQEVLRDMGASAPVRDAIAAAQNDKQGLFWTARNSSLTKMLQDRAKFRADLEAGQQQSHSKQD